MMCTTILSLVSEHPYLYLCICIWTELPRATYKMHLHKFKVEVSRQRMRFNVVKACERSACSATKEI